MDWQDDRPGRRLTFDPAWTEAFFTRIAGIDAIGTAIRLTDRLLPQTLDRLTQSVIVTSTGASNRIEGDRLTGEEVEALYRNLRLRKLRTRDEQEVAGYLEMLELILAAHADMPLSEAPILPRLPGWSRSGASNGSERAGRRAIGWREPMMSHEGV